MQYRIFILTFFALLVLGGCKSTAYYHPNKPESAWGDDQWLCEASVEVLAETGRLDVPSEEQAVEDCMRGLGYVYGHDPHPNVNTSEMAGFDSTETEYSVMESAYHIQVLAEQRRAYLIDTGVRGVYVKHVDLGSEGQWFRVMIGSYENLDSARRLKDELSSRYGLRNLVILRENDILAGY
ncbi:MAG: SPOR domain-containing protein [Desulfovibrio sp.]|nr:MAG: SPOR domain-containing protein [Desulfovibrio sp.]